MCVCVERGQDGAPGWREGACTHLHPLSILQERRSRLEARQPELPTSVFEVQRRRAGLVLALLLSPSECRRVFLWTLSGQTALEGDIMHVWINYTYLSVTEKAALKLTNKPAIS